MNLPAGKGLFLWKPPYVAGGSIAYTVQAALDMGLSVVNMKVGSGVYEYPFQGYDLRPLRKALGTAGILVYGWHYVYGANNPKDEAALAGKQIAALDLDGYEIDAEAHYKGYGYRQAGELMQRMKEYTVQADIPLGFDSYRYPNYHRELPWRGFLEHPDYFTPQVYWQPPPSGPVVELDRSLKEWSDICGEYGYPVKPFFPAGRVYIGDGYPPSGPPSSEVTAFLRHAKDDLALPGATFWSFDNLYTHTGGEARAAAIAAFGWSTAPPDLSDHEKTTILWDNHPEYHP